jgi:hypothetical protein
MSPSPLKKTLQSTAGRRSPWDAALPTTYTGVQNVSRSAWVKTDAASMCVSTDAAVALPFCWFCVLPTRCEVHSVPPVPPSGAHLCSVGACLQPWAYLLSKSHRYQNDPNLRLSTLEVGTLLRSFHHLTFVRKYLV